MAAELLQVLSMWYLGSRKIPQPWGMVVPHLASLTDVLCFEFSTCSYETPAEVCHYFSGTYTVNWIPAEDWLLAGLIISVNKWPADRHSSGLSKRKGKQSNAGLFLSRVSGGRGWGIWDLLGKAHTVQALGKSLGSISMGMGLPGRQDLLLLGSE